PNFPRAAELARGVIEQILAHRPAAGTLFNVNIPSLEQGPVRGIRTVPQNVAPYVENFDRRVDPRGRAYFWTRPDFCCPAPHPDTDVTTLADGYITVTPLQFDLTHQVLLRQMNGWKWRLEVRACPAGHSPPAQPHPSPQPRPPALSPLLA